MGQLRLLGEPAGSDDHAAMANLAFPQAGHTGFVASAGLAGGQTIIGGTAAGENLSLQSTAHAARGVVRLIDALRLISGLIQDSGGNARITLASASPHVTLTGDARLGDRCAISADPLATTALRIAPSLEAATGNLYVIDATPLAFQLTGPGSGSIVGINATATGTVQPGATASFYGMRYTAGAGGAGTINNLYGCWVRTVLLSYSGPAPNLYGFLAYTPMLLGSTAPANITGVEIRDMGPSAVASNAIGLKIADQTTVTGNKYLIEAGPTTPYLRLVGGAAPGANLTNLYLNEGGTLRRVQWVDPGIGGVNLQAGQRVLVLV